MEVQEPKTLEKKFAEMQSKATIDAGILAIKAVFAINGGAAIAYFAFLGNIVAKKGSEFAEERWLANFPLIAFACGIACAVAAIGCTYKSDEYSALCAREFSETNPAREITIPFSNKAFFWQGWAIKSFCSSLAFFALGIGLTVFVISMALAS